MKKKKKDLPQIAVKTAQKFLKSAQDELDMLRMHDFPDDEAGP